MITDTTRTRVAEAIDGLPLRTELITAGDRTGPAFALAQTLELTTSPAEVWAHLTDPALLAQWSPIVPDRPLDTVGPAASRENPADGPVDATVITADAPHHLSHRWGPGLVTWTLVERPGGCTLGIGQDFATDAEAAMTAAGWHVCFAVLSLRLRGVDVERVVGADAMEVGWEDLSAQYSAGSPRSD